MANGQKRKPGRMSKVERAIVAEVIRVEPELPRARQVALAVALNKPTDTIANEIDNARSKLQSHADKYVDLHLDAAMSALANGDFDVARKGASWALENISATDSDGKTHRIVDKQVSSANDHAPKVQIGIAIGGLPKANLARSVD